MIYNKNFKNYLFPPLCSWSRRVFLSKVAGFVFAVVLVVLVFSSFNLSALSAEVFGNSIFLYNYPNPFDSRNTSTNILIKKPAHLKNVTIKIYDLFGQPVKRIDTESIAGNIVIWDGRDEEGRYVAKGGYLCVVTAADGSITALRKIGVIH